MMRFIILVLVSVLLPSCTLGHVHPPDDRFDIDYDDIVTETKKEAIKGNPTPPVAKSQQPTPPSNVDVKAIKDWIRGVAKNQIPQLITNKIASIRK